MSDLPGVDGVRPWRRTPGDGFPLLGGRRGRGRGPAGLVPEEGRLLEDLCRIHLGSRLPHLLLLTLGGFGRGGAGGFVMPRRGVIVSLLLFQITEFHHTPPVRGKEGNDYQEENPVFVCVSITKLVTKVAIID